MGNSRSSRSALRLLDSLVSAAKRPKDGLFGCACCRRIWHHLQAEISRRAVETAELFVDGLATARQLAVLRKNKGAFPNPQAGWQCTLSNGNDAGKLACREASGWMGAQESSHGIDAFYAGIRAEQVHQAALFRCIVSNPFRPLTLDSSWLTSSVLDLATGIYEDRAFDRMPILADALMDAGCANDDILQHCRTGGPHVRGCWVVDLLLGKA